jgi:hypothetical protein
MISTILIRMFFYNALICFVLAKHMTPYIQENEDYKQDPFISSPSSKLTQTLFLFNLTLFERNLIFK